MSFKITANSKEWNDFFNTFPREQKDIYFDYRYALAYEKNGDGKIYSALFKGKNGMRVLYPFIMTKIPNYGLGRDYFDISSLYGYGGPLIQSYNKTDMQKFEINLYEWCIKNNVVAEFIRYHPLMDNFNKFSRDIITEENRQTVYIDLSTSCEKIWKNSITSKNRNQIRKAEKSGLVIKEHNDIETFVHIYNETMQRIGASDYFYFSEAYFQELKKLIPENMMILDAVFEEKVIASAMFMYMGNQMHYHLAGSIQDYQKFCPNNLIIYTAIKHGLAKGVKWLHLGGGTTNLENDSLLKFKKSFSSNIGKFYIGKRVHNRDIYDLLIGKWEAKKNKKAKLFLQYEFV